MLLKAQNMQSKRQLMPKPANTHWRRECANAHRREGKAGRAMLQLHAKEQAASKACSATHMQQSS